MLSNHRFMFVGNVAKEPVLTVTGSGKVLGKMSVCVNDRWLDKETGEARHKALYFNVTSFDPTTCKKMESLSQGSYVILEGDIVPNKFTDRNGNEVYVTNFMATCLDSPNYKRKEKPATTTPEVEPPPFMEDTPPPAPAPKKKASTFEIAEDIFNDLDV